MEVRPTERIPVRLVEKIWAEMEKRGLDERVADTEKHCMDQSSVERKGKSMELR